MSAARPRSSRAVCALVFGLLAAAVVLAAPPPGAPGQRPEPDPTLRPKSRLFPPQDLGLLEPPDRTQWQQPDRIMDALRIFDGAKVADLGAGGGWFTIQLARRVGPNGIVYAEDVQTQMIEGIRRRSQREGLSNVRPVLGSVEDPLLPVGLDAVLIVSAYHEMACAGGPSCQAPVTLMRNVARSLKPQGRLGVVDFYPGEGGPGPAADERVNPEEVIRAAEAAGFQLTTREDIPPFEFQFLLVFSKPPPPPRSSP